MANGKVISLDAYVDEEIRTLAKAVYNTRKRHDAATAQHVRAMIAFTKACDRLNVDPARVQIGELSGAAFYSVSVGRRKHGKR